MLSYLNCLRKEKGVYIKFYFGLNQIFEFGLWSISCNCLPETPESGTHYGCYFNAVILTENKFDFG